MLLDIEIKPEYRIEKKTRENVILKKISIFLLIY